MATPQQLADTGFDIYEIVPGSIYDFIVDGTTYRMTVATALTTPQGRQIDDLKEVLAIHPPEEREKRQAEMVAHQDDW